MDVVVQKVGGDVVRMTIVDFVVHGRRIIGIIVQMRRTVGGQNEDDFVFCSPRSEALWAL